MVRNDVFFIAEVSAINIVACVTDSLTFFKSLKERVERYNRLRLNICDVTRVLSSKQGGNFARKQYFRKGLVIILSLIFCDIMSECIFPSEFGGLNRRFISQ